MIFYSSSVSSNYEDDKLISIETSISEKGLPVFEIFGLVSKSIEESKKRITNSFESIGINFPLKNISINFSPAEFSKEGTHFDLALAFTLLQYTSAVQAPKEKCIFLGELSFDGSVKGLKNITYLVLTAKNFGFEKIFVPHSNLSELKFLGLKGIYGVLSLKDFLNLETIPEYKEQSVCESRRFEDTFFSKIIGNRKNKRIIALALAGKHHLLLNGYPGSGKSLLAKSAGDLLPDLSYDDAFEVAKLHSFVSNKRNTEDFLRPPFRAPHSSSSYSSIFGSTGKYLVPGEIVLSNKGLLFLDEFPEFNRLVIEGLRAPLEDKCITVSRAKLKKTLPTDFILIAAMNPCKCGYFNHPKKQCSCLPVDIKRYQGRISGPIMDRLDIQLFYDGTINLSSAKEEINYSYEEFLKLKSKIVEIRGLLEPGCVGKSLKGGLDNLSKDAIHNYFSTKSMNLINSLVENYSLSNRRYLKILKLSRTISLFESTSTVEPNHILEALSLSSFSEGFK